MEISSFLKEITETKSVPVVYSKAVLTNQTKTKILSYQEKHIIKLINTLVEKTVAVDGSDCGVGKTYIAGAVCKELGRRPIVVCPKTLIHNWINVMEYYGVKPYDIVNFETIRRGKTYVNSKCKTRRKCEFVDIVDPDPDNPLKSIYQWDLPKDAIIIVDEVHRCKDPSTDNGKVLMSFKQAVHKKIPVLLLSATICEKIIDMKIPFFLFGLIPSVRNFNHYVRTLRHKYPKYRVKKSDHKNTTDYIIAKDNAQAMIIHEETKEFASRIKIKDLGDMFPCNQICAQQFFAQESDKISEAYDEIAELMKKLKENPGSNHLAKIQKLKQEIELRKAPIFIEQAQLYLDDGKSVIIFVNYLDTMKIISQELDIRCKIHGDQTLEERQNALDMFQSNEERIIILQARAGGVGLNLHDTNGNFPRVSLLNYPDSASDLLQELGRAARAGTKSIVLQRIIFVANVDYEKKIMQNINKKLSNISAINDGDLEGYKYKVKKITRKVVKKQKELEAAIKGDLETIKEI